MAMCRHSWLFSALLVLTLSGINCKHQPPTPVKESTEPVWIEVGTWSGRGDAQLETFPVDYFTWRVRWEAKNESRARSGALQVTANSADSGRTIAEVVDKQGVGTDVTYITELPRRYYLAVTSTGVDWTLTAEALIPR